MLIQIQNTDQKPILLVSVPGFKVKTWNGSSGACQIYRNPGSVVDPKSFLRIRIRIRIQIRTWLFRFFKWCILSHRRVTSGQTAFRYRRRVLLVKFVLDSGFGHFFLLFFHCAPFSSSESVLGERKIFLPVCKSSFFPALIATAYDGQDVGMCWLTVGYVLS